MDRWLPYFLILITYEAGLSVSFACRAGGGKKEFIQKKGLGTYCGLFWNSGLCVKVLLLLLSQRPKICQLAE